MVASRVGGTMGMAGGLLVAGEPLYAGAVSSTGAAPGARARLREGR